MGKKELPPEAECPVRNTDRIDTDLENYARQVYEPPKKKGGCMGMILILLALFALTLGYLVLKLGGIIA